ncbi:NADH dehydrogenase [ubiquinone] iron-sulfur protein 6, mitochondrial [Ambystoma mexicanum]|uniref:NADH dehydrogenase [ubiquinone] iron-sulfur protein 6, mitochondrial n=1 Tax=Ambystoma mexicanum TaxID=8296 RepID=UPI0037E8A6F2
MIGVMLSCALRRVVTRGSFRATSPCVGFSWSRNLHGAQVNPSVEKVTHTGQVFDEHDYRKVRFVARQKEVNEQFAIDLIKEEPVSEVDSRVVSCDGGGGALGHPKVYINLDKETKIGTCGYCGLQFKKNPHH